MESLKEWLRNSEEFENAFTDAKEFVREEINPFIDTLEMDKNTKCDYCFPLRQSYVLGLDKEKLTVWIFYDETLYNASIEEREVSAEKKKQQDLKRIEEIKKELEKLYEEKAEILERYKVSICEKESCINCDQECPYSLGEFEKYRYI